MRKVLIRFEDHMQDFLAWEVLEDGTITDSLPFQFSIWSKWTITNFNELKVGGYVEIKKDDKEMTIKYPIEEIRELPQ